MFQKLALFTQRFAYHPHAYWWLFFYAVIESVFFPIPPEVMFLPMALANPRKALVFSTIAAIGSAAGGMVGYGIGHYLFEPVALPVLDWFCQYSDKACPNHFIPVVQNLFAKQGLLMVAISALSPVIPYRFITIAAGFGNMSFAGFVAMSLAVHWIRYSILAWLVARYGEAAYEFAKERVPLVFTVIGAVALVVFLAVTYF